MKMKLKYLKRRLRFNKKRSYFFIFLFLLVCSVGLGYAAISTTLSIDGSAQFKDARWNVYFDNLNVTTGSITTTTPASITDTTTVSFGVKLENPGDFYEFSVDVVNGGNMNAMIDSFNILPELSAAQQNYLSYTVTYSDGVGLAKYQKLNAGSTEKLKVRFKYLENADASLYPTEDDNLTIAFDVTYVQADSNAIKVVHPLNGIVYTINRWDTDGFVSLNQGFPDTIPYFETPAEALSDMRTKLNADIHAYLKHKVENGIVTEQYVVFEITEALAQENIGIVPGVYELRGIKTYDPASMDFLPEYYSTSPYYEANKEVMKLAFGYLANESLCTEETPDVDEEMTGELYSTFSCGVNDFYVTSGMNGAVSAGSSTLACYSESGDAHCS